MVSRTERCGFDSRTKIIYDREAESKMPVMGIGLKLLFKVAALFLPISVIPKDT